LLYINVPYEEKDEAKSMYPKWDRKKRKWYATNPKFYFRFNKWIEGRAVAQNKVYRITSVSLIIAHIKFCNG